MIERVVRYARAAYVDFRLFLARKADPTLPPLRLRFVGTGDFRAVGDHLLDLTITRAQLTPSSRILDVGSGSGRLALPLARYLREGSYEGFDVVKGSVRWCRRNISSRHRNFRFRHVSLRNSDYSVRGKSAAEFVFPYDDASFDCVVAYSVFTHLQLTEMRNYLQQTYRVLIRGGRFVATFFLFTAGAEEKDTILTDQFPHESVPLRFAKTTNRAFAVAIEEGFLQNLLREIGFSDIRLEHGYWTGRSGSSEYQDLVICTK